MLRSRNIGYNLHHEELLSVNNLMFKILNSARYNKMVRLVLFLEQGFSFFLDNSCKLFMLKK